MDKQRTLHIVGGDSRSRAEQARTAFALGHHAEIYADVNELIARPRCEGVVLAGGELLDLGLGKLIDRLGAAGMWLPVVAIAERPSVQDVVRAVEEGALDFLPLPLEHGELARMLGKLDGAAERHVAGRRTTVEAQRRITTLSRRERQVLDWLAEGSSNKVIARELDISPRTVEIHRANMMAKLGVQHAAEAVRMQCVAGLASTACPDQAADDLAEQAPVRLPVTAARVPARSPATGAPLRHAA